MLLCADVATFSISIWKLVVCFREVVRTEHLQPSEEANMGVSRLEFSHFCECITLYIPSLGSVGVEAEVEQLC